MVSVLRQVLAWIAYLISDGFAALNNWSHGWTEALRWWGQHQLEAAGVDLTTWHEAHH